MTVEELAVVKKFLHDAVDSDLPALIEAEEARLPEPWKSLASGAVSTGIKALIALADAKIDALGA